MSGSWGEAVADQARTCGRPEYLPTHMFEQYKHRRLNGRHPISFTGEQRAAYLAGVADVLVLQRGWFDLPPADAIWELRRGAESIFHPFFEDGAIQAECPSDRSHNAGTWVAVDVEGTCWICGYDFMSPTPVRSAS